MMRYILVNWLKMKIYQFDHLDPEIEQSSKFRQAVKVAFQNLFGKNSGITPVTPTVEKRLIDDYLNTFYQGSTEVLERIRKGELEQVLEEYPLWYFSCIEKHDFEFFQRWKDLRPGTFEWYICPHQCQDVAYIVQTYCSLKWPKKKFWIMNTLVHTLVTDSNDYQDVLNGSATIYDFNYLLILNKDFLAQPESILRMEVRSRINFYPDYFQFRYEMYDRII